MKYKWEKLGRIITPQKNIYWMKTWTGASFVRQVEDTSIFEIFVTGRDDKNRSRIGKVFMDFDKNFKIISIEEEPVFTLGELGSFDENGVSYPWLFSWQNTTYMLYVGWMPTVLTPFKNELGLARELKNGNFERVSRAPILSLNNDDYLSIGSSCVIVEENIIRLYYTSFLKWGEKGEYKHYYLIKYAESTDAINWNRNNHICIDFAYDWEFSIGRPSVIKMDDVYNMWFSYRGNKPKGYFIGYAYSFDGKNFVRDDENAGITLSKEGWDSEMICYSHVFNYKNNFYMIYCGNEYGRDGIGIARLEKSF
jgi:hypothetical protein